MKLVFYGSHFGLFLIFFSYCSLGEIFVRKNHYTRTYTTADVLNVREKPDINSRIIMQIPYGSPIETFPTKFENDSGEIWYFAKDVKGYILGTFLSKELPAQGKKKLVLKSESDYSECDSEFISDKTVLELAEGLVLSKIFSVAWYQTDKSEQKGKYRLEEGTIVIELQEGKMVTRDGTVELYKKEKIGPRTFELIYNPDLKGYITKEEEKYLDKTKYFRNLQRCFLIEKEYKQFQSKQEFCNSKNSLGRSANFYGYYCNR